MSFASEGFNEVIVLHDLDRDPNTNMLNSEPKLRAVLEQIECPSAISRFICIPVEELEAWFWSDPNVLSIVGRGPIKAPYSPHLILRPKEALMRLSLGANSKPRYTTEDNAELAGTLDLQLCSSRCSSFSSLLRFLLPAA
jgi:hypothetical protein